MPRHTASLLIVHALLSLHCWAAPRPLLPGDLAAAGLDFPGVQHQFDNTTEVSWFSRLARRFDTAPTTFQQNPKTTQARNGKERPVTTANPLSSVNLIPMTTSVRSTTAQTTKTTTKASSTVKTTTSSASAQTTSTLKPAGGAASAASSSMTYPTLAAVPSQVQALYNQVSNGKACPNVLDSKTGGYKANGDGGNFAHYCGDTKVGPEVVYWMSNMDIDCDGATKSGPCGNDPSHLSETAFTYNGKPIDAMSVPYVVINEDKASCRAFCMLTSNPHAQYFKPRQYGISGLATIGVVCNGQLTWAVFGDTNELGSMGEGSLTLGQACFGSSMTADNGWDTANVLYFAFTGSQAVDPLGGTNFQSLAALGNSLIASRL